MAEGVASAVDNQLNKIYLMPNHVFPSNGTILGFEYTAEVVGSIIAQVM